MFCQFPHWPDRKKKEEKIFRHWNFCPINPSPNNLDQILKGTLTLYRIGGCFKMIGIAMPMRQFLGATVSFTVNCCSHSENKKKKKKLIVALNLKP